jgi:O-succinylbenzoate synthase
LIDSDFFCHPSVRRLIIKPAREGGLLVSIERALRAKASGIEVIVTSSLESACGLLTCAQLAAAIAPKAVHGLGTAEWFADDTGATPVIAGGRLYLPQVPGIGFKPTGN